MELKSIGYKSQQEKFEERFAIADGIGENGSYKLTADGCNKRHDLSRDAMNMTEAESKKRNWELPNRAEWEEQQIQLKLFTYFQKGYKLREDESAEDFIERIEQDVD